MFIFFGFLFLSEIKIWKEGYGYFLKNIEVASY